MGRRYSAVMVVLGATAFAATERRAYSQPSAPADRPRELSGALVIAGGGRLPNAIPDRFVELAGGKQARIVIIPTASVMAEQPESLATYNYFKQLGVQVDLLHTRDRRQADEETFCDRLRQATGVWLTGGDQSRLIATYCGTRIEQELHQLLEKGMVIGGTSAGAAVMSSLAIVGGNSVAEVGAGFGLLPGFVIDQHFHNRLRLPRLRSVLARHPRHLGLGIDEQTAVVIVGRRMSVVGTANVRVLRAADKPQQDVIKVLKDGDQVDVVQLYDELIVDNKTSE
jgi:cyanophycinase